MRKSLLYLTLYVLSGSLLILSSCAQITSDKVIVTSESGDILSEKEAITFRKKEVTANVIKVDIENPRQTIDGIGSSLTESSAFVLASISKEKRNEVLHELFSETGANFPISRTHIGSCDFSVEGKYSYLEREDHSLESFSLDRDREGFSKEDYPGIIDESYDLLPLIKDVIEIKNTQNDTEFRLVASPWTAPAWMKDNKAYFEHGYGGSLLKENYEVFANYFIRYFEEMQKEGIDIWAITPINEPEGNNGQWESMHFSPEEEADFIAKHLGPAIEKSSFGDIKIFGFDQNRPELPHWAEGIYNNPDAAKYITGMAIHWYASTFESFESILDSIHNLYPDRSILHTEGCIDNLGVAAGDWAQDPDGWQEEGWFKDDSWWWHKNASDWGYKTSWGGPLHALYAPTHRYARNIIESINNWMTGFIDWNVILDKNGGPNHVGNFCGAPIMIDTDNDDIYYTPVYHVLKHFSKTIRPGDVALKCSEPSEKLYDKIYVGATRNKQNKTVVSILNVTEEDLFFNLQLGDYSAEIQAPANALQTVIVSLK